MIYSVYSKTFGLGRLVCDSKATLEADVCYNNNNNNNNIFTMRGVSFVPVK
jgi:hypothetical protein